MHARLLKNSVGGWDGRLAHWSVSRPPKWMTRRKEPSMGDDKAYVTRANNYTRLKRPEKKRAEEGKPHVARRGASPDAGSLTPENHLETLRRENTSPTSSLSIGESRPQPKHNKLVSACLRDPSLLRKQRRRSIESSLFNVFNLFFHNESKPHLIRKQRRDGRNASELRFACLILEGLLIFGNESVFRGLQAEIT